MSRMLEAAGPSHCYHADVQSESRARVSSVALSGWRCWHLTLKDLMLPFPVEWAGQRERFGVAGVG